MLGRGVGAAVISVAVASKPSHPTDQLTRRMPSATNVTSLENALWRTVFHRENRVTTGIPVKF